MTSAVYFQTVDKKFVDNFEKTRSSLSVDKADMEKCEKSVESR